MKKNYIFKVTVLVVLGLMGFSQSAFSASYQWKGGGDGVSWMDAANWDLSTDNTIHNVPTSADFAVFPSSAGTLTVVKGSGTPNTIKGIFINNNADITINLDLNLVFTGGNQGSIRIFENSTLTIASNKTLNIDANSNANGEAIEFRKTGGTFEVEFGAVVNITAKKGFTSNADATTGCKLDNYGRIDFNTTTAAIRADDLTSLAIVNNTCAVMNLGSAAGDGSKILLWAPTAVPVVAASIVNDGLITYGGTGAGISVVDDYTATNNGFFSYTNAGSFSAGSGLNQVDNGVTITGTIGSGTVTLAAGASCTVDLNGGNSGMDIYTWKGASTLTNNGGQNLADGNLDLTGADFSGASPYTIEITDACATTYNDTFTVTVATTCAAALPVELTKFTATQKDEINILEWQTASEENNARFEVERSKDGVEFQKIGEVEGNGTTFEISNYDFIDENPMAVSYYRLRQVDYNGQFEYSEMVVVRNEASKATKAVAIAPNPVHDQMIISNGVGQATIYNVLGQPVRSININEASFYLNVNDLPQGQYFLRVIKTNGEISTLQFVK